MTADRWDVVVVGGGSAGLSAALMLVRARRRVLVLDSGAPRNRFAAHMHAVLGRDGTSPARLPADGRAEVEKYGGVVSSAEAVQVRRSQDGLVISTADGRRLGARRLLVATGLRDELPAIAGLREQWGRGVVVCPYCDGYEVRDQRIGVLGSGAFGPLKAQLLRQWSDSVVYLAHTAGAPTGEDRVALDARGIDVEEGGVARVLDDGGRLTGVQFDDGRTVELDVIFAMPDLVPLDDLLVRLGAERVTRPMGSFVAVDPTGRTSVEGVWAAGNVVNEMANVPVSMGAGALAGGAINLDLVQEDVRLAVAAQPAGVR